MAIGLGLVLVAAFALPLFESWFLQPLTGAKNDLAGVQGRVAKLRESENQLKLAKRNLDDWQYESLPPNPFTAQREYQEWLMDLARMSGFSNPVPSLGNVPTRGRTFIEIPVTIQAKATLEQLARFLYHFERVALLHRVQSLSIESPASIGNPLLDVTLVARGLSLVDAPQRSRLFPTTTLQEAVTAQTQTLRVEPAKGFPLVEGFEVKIDEELLTVRQHGKDHWTIERGAETTQAAEHAAGSIVELFPVDREAFESGRSFEQYLALLESSPFTKPAPRVDYKPELSPSSAQVVTRGTPWVLKLSVSGWDPAGGPAVYSLGADAPRGMTLDALSGELAWSPGKDVEARAYDVPIIVKSEILSGQQVAMTLPVTLREPNLPPTVQKVDPLTAYSGRPLSYALQADDPDGDNGALKFALTGTVPAGATIDAMTGEIKWLPPLTLELGDYKLNVAVSDSGDPQQTTTEEVAVKLQDDAALFTRLVGIFQQGQRPEAMLSNLTTGETTRLTQGAEVTAADVTGTIVGIEVNHIVLEVGEQRYRLEMGRNLRQMTPIDAAAGSEPPAADSAPG